MNQGLACLLYCGWPWPLTFMWRTASIENCPTSITDHITCFMKGPIFAPAFSSPHRFFQSTSPTSTRGPVHWWHKRSDSLHFTLDFYILIQGLAVLKWDRLPTQRLRNIKRAQLPSSDDNLRPWGRGWDLTNTRANNTKADEPEAIGRDFELCREPMWRRALVQTRCKIRPGASVNGWS